MKKIVHIIYSGLGGHFSVTQSLISADTARKYVHFIIFYGVEQIPEPYAEKCRADNTDFCFIRKKAGLDIASLRKLSATLRQQQPDIILLNSVNLIVTVARFASKSKARVIAVEHQSNELKTKKDWIWSLLIMRLAKRVVYLTDTYKDQMQKKLGMFYRSAKVRVINNGINIDLFSPANHAVPSGHFNIGMLSRLTGIKDHITLIRSFKQLLTTHAGTGSYRLLIAGEGATRPALEQLVVSLQLSDHVIFMGMLNENESAAMLDQLTIYVHASYGETMSTAIMQAMASGKPVIASDVQGINNMIAHNITGLLVPVENAAAMAAAMKQLMTNEELRNSLSAAARAHAVSHFSNSAMFAKYETAFLH